MARNHPPPTRQRRMNETTPGLQSLDRIEIAILMDAYANLLLPASSNIQRVSSHDLRIEPPVAGHGFSALVETWLGDTHRTVLIDAGYPKAGVLHNWRSLAFDPNRVDAVFITHGHFDHFAALEEFLQARRARVPLVMHPDVFLKRVVREQDGRQREMPPMYSRAMLERWGADVVLSDQPYELVPGVMSTGQIPRVTSFEQHTAPTFAERAGNWEPDNLPDDQAIIAKVHGKGLVVLTGCGHAGIVNTLKHAQTVTGETRVHTIVGGFHLTNASPEKIGATAQEIESLQPALLVPMHCTGFVAQTEFARRMPEAFVVSAVGTRVIVSAA